MTSQNKSGAVYDDSSVWYMSHILLSFQRQVRNVSLAGGIKYTKKSRPIPLLKGLNQGLVSRPIEDTCELSGKGIPKWRSCCKGLNGDRCIEGRTNSELGSKEFARMAVRFWEHHGKFAVLRRVDS